MEPRTIVVVSLHSPKERLWGELLDVSSAGVTLPDGTAAEVGPGRHRLSCGCRAPDDDPLPGPAPPDPWLANEP